MIKVENMTPLLQVFNMPRSRPFIAILWAFRSLVVPVMLMSRVGFGCGSMVAI